MTVADPTPLAERVAALVDDIERGTQQFMEDYEKAGEGISRRISGEAAALIVQERSVLLAALRALLAQPAPAPTTEAVPGQAYDTCVKCGRFRVDHLPGLCTFRAAPDPVPGDEVRMIRAQYVRGLRSTYGGSAEDGAHNQILAMNKV